MSIPDNEYYWPRRFAANSKLHRYLAYKCPGFINICKKDYNLYEVLLAMKKVISSEKLFDVQNPTVIICDPCLEDALEVKALHVSEIKDFVGKQFFLIDPNQQTVDSIGLQNGDSFQLPSWASSSANAVIARVNACNNFDIEGKYKVKPEFLKLLHSVKGVNPNQTVFHYREITQLLSDYIMGNKHSFFDLKNIRVAMVGNDQLGKAFGVRAFARSQVTSLLRAQLVPCEVENDLHAVNPVEDAIKESEDVGSEQSEETASEQSEENASEDSVYRVEYEIVESSDEERKSDFSDDSEIEDVKVVQVAVQDTDVVYCAAESSDEESNQHVLVQKERKCVACDKCDSLTLKYCVSCWQDRKAWVPRRKRRFERNASATTSKVAKYELNDCSICFIRTKNASFIHGQTSHQVCCYQCAKKIYKNKDGCPVCRRQIEKITKHFLC